MQTRSSEIQGNGIVCLSSTRALIPITYDATGCHQLAVPGFGMEKKIAHLSENGINRPGTGQGMARRRLVPNAMPT